MPFKPSTFGHRFLEVKRAAARTKLDKLSKPLRARYDGLMQQRRMPVMPLIERAPGEPDFIDKLFLDLRDTGLTRLALGQLERFGHIDLLVLGAISGHALQSITGILKHYIAMDKAMSDRGIAALSHYMKTKGIAV